MNGPSFAHGSVVTWGLRPLGDDEDGCECECECEWVLSARVTRDLCVRIVLATHPSLQQPLRPFPLSHSPLHSPIPLNMRGRGRRGGFNHDRNGFASDPWQPAHTPTSTSLAGQLPSSVPSAPPPSSTAYITAGNVRDDPASKANQHLAATVNEWAAYAHRCRKVALKADAVLTSSGAPSSLAGVDWEAKAVSEEDARKKAAAEVAGLKAGLDVQTKIAADARAGMDFEKTSRDEVVGRLFREADILRAELAQAKSLLANATKPLIGGQPVTAPAADDSVRISPALRKQMSALGCSTQETHVDDGIKVRLPQTKPAAAAPTTRHQLPQAVVAPSDSGTPAVSPTRSARVSVPTPVVADPENFSTQRVSPSWIGAD